MCECCGLPIETEPIPVCTSNIEYNFLGAGVPLYFDFIKTCIYTIIITTVVYGIYGIVTNNRGTNCKEIDTV